MLRSIHAQHNGRPRRHKGYAGLRPPQHIDASFCGYSWPCHHDPASTLIPSVSLHLLTQDNSIPGNHKDGFRYRHLLFVILVTPLYLWFELAFGVSLLDAMSANVIIDDTKAIEHWGRLISGAALALLLLSGWLKQWERDAMHWGKGLVGALGIGVFSLLAAWWVQGKVLEFYIERASTELPWAVGSLAVLVLAGFFITRYWLQRAAMNARSRVLWISAAVVCVLVLGFVQLTLIKEVNPLRAQLLGVERQQTATLSIIRRALQEELYTLPGMHHDRSAFASPEGKTFLALFPIFGVVFDQAAFAADRPRLIAEFMYRDWDRDFGAQAYAGYQLIDADFNRRLEQDYLGTRRALDLGDRLLPPGLSLSAAQSHPVVRRHFGRELGCFDCQFTSGMSREAFGRSLHAHTKAHEIAEAIETFGSASRFETGRTGERAARTYWAPILALLFSMLGAFTHVFKLIITITAYSHRLTFDRIDAADSPLAHEVIANSNRVTAGAIIALALFCYYSDNRITGHARYLELRPQLWEQRPIAGGFAGHWTINAQGLIYPFTRKIRPAWLSFDADPVLRIPVVRGWFAEQDYQ